MNITLWKPDPDSEYIYSKGEKVELKNVLHFKSQIKQGHQLGIFYVFEEGQKIQEKKIKYVEIVVEGI